MDKSQSTGRYDAGREFALLADARSVEHLARTLLADCGEDLALHDAVVPFQGSTLGYGKGILATRIAVGEARGAQRAMEYGEDIDVADRRLYLAKRAFVIAEEIAGRLDGPRSWPPSQRAHGATACSEVPDPE